MLEYDCAPTIAKIEVRMSLNVRVDMDCNNLLADMLYNLRCGRMHT
jgi:hypothetical protein